MNSVFRKLFSHRKALVLMLVLALSVFATAAFASTLSASGSASGSVPWDTGLNSLVTTLSGPTALYVSMIGLFFAGGLLIFGGDLGNFGRMTMMVVLVGSMLTGVSSLVTRLVYNGALLF